MDDGGAPASEAPLIVVEGLHKTYPGVAALAGVDLTVRAGEVVALRGPSGSGKSTLLNILGCLDRPTKGRYLLEGRDVSTLDRTAQAQVRLRRLGFIFQSFHLVKTLTAIENVALPLFYAGLGRQERFARARGVLERVGLGERLSHLPTQLSGGQRQRVAIARACVTRPSLMLADEPTGALDTRSGEEVLALLGELHDELGLTILMVTHDAKVAEFAGRQVHLEDGRIVSAAEVE